MIHGLIYNLNLIINTQMSFTSTANISQYIGLSQVLFGHIQGLRYNVQAHADTFYGLSTYL